MAYMETSGCVVPTIELGNNNSGNGNGMFGNNGDWAWIIILFLIFGFGGNSGFGGGFGGGSGVADNYVLTSDFSQLSRQISDGFNTTERRTDQIINGLCDGFYNMAQQFSNTNQNIFMGNANLTQTLTQGFAGLNQGLVTQGYETRLGTQALAADLANCCCDIRQEIAKCCCETQGNIKDVSYNIAMGNNALANALCNSTRDIIDNQNANYRAIHEELLNSRLEQKNERIAELTAKVERANDRAESQYIIRELTPKCPQPAYVVNGPTPVNFPTNCCNTFSGFNNGCGCGC